MSGRIIESARDCGRREGAIDTAIRLLANNPCPYCLNSDGALRVSPTATVLHACPHCYGTGKIRINVPIKRKEAPHHD